MTIRHLKIFVTVCECRTVTAAGKKLFLAQPSVSLAIANLEKHYGVKLFDRIGKRLQITEAGKRLLQYGRHIVGLFEDMEKEMMDIDSLGVLRIGASMTIGNYLLPGYIQAFKETYPDVDVKVIIDNTETIQEAILTNRIDVGLVEGPTHDPYIITEKFQEDELVLICGNEHPFATETLISLAQLTDEKWILREPGSAGRDIFDSTMQARGLNLEPSWESSSSQAIIQAVKTNLGVSILPYLLVKDALDRNEIKRFRLADLSFKRDFFIIYHQNKFIGAAAKVFMAICQ